jgi:hypothetical protein
MSRLAAAVLLICGLAGCSGGSSSSSPPTNVLVRNVSAKTGTVLRLPSVGEVVVRREPREGIVLRDQATHGKRFFLSAIQAGECLSYLKANPNASESDVRAACPGEAVVAMVQKQAAAQAR